MRYEARAAVAMGSVVLLGTIGFVGLRSAMAPPLRAFPLSESTDTFVVRNPELIRPSAALYASFASEDEAWRRRFAQPASRSVAADRAVLPAPWRPSARQSLDDRVYAAMKAQRFDEAIALLTGWLEQHPRDGEELLKLARLLNQTGRLDESAERYRQLLALAQPRTR